ncbi:nuclear transport factor 2 family protein [Modestobacter altitudinis]|uniref:nuclear transport factor 2 family protein n=1 Tax=Modestobacter altitudinis TaxID=2213158 RepID=UPI00110CD1B4|nr:nuclear transport factor 2 family protein [Modestobacter altitudinis]
MTTTVGTTVVDSYARAWLEPDPVARRALLEQCWAVDGVYCDPLSQVTGRDGLADHIGGFQAGQPGARLEVVSGVDEHDGHLRFAWQLRAADGSVALEGTDFGELDGDGVLRRIIGFFGPLPPGGPTS